MTYKHWQLDTIANEGGEGEVLFLGFDRAERSTNTMSDDVLDELETIIQNLKSQTSVKGLVIQSLKDNGFIAGADVEGFKELDTEEKAKAFLNKGQRVFAAIEALSIPTIALIKGFCMGGGTELVLACDYRIACDDDKTRIGLPEVKLGIHPGWGGTVRAVQKVGVFAAMDMMLTGRGIRASAAKRMGLVDAAVPMRQFRRSAFYYVNHKPKQTQPKWWLRLLNMGLFRGLIASQLEKQVAKKAKKEHYPSPYAIIDLWRKYGGEPTEQAYAEEINSIAGLFAGGDASRNLIRVFFLMERLKGLAKNSDFEPKHVHVIGAGTMGGDIAAWCALRGFRVTLQDREIKYIAPAIKRAHALYKKRLKKPQLVRAAMDRLIPDVDGLGVRSADVIIEAIYENLEAKQNLFKDLEKNAKKDAILASNTSSIPISEINSVMKKPERLIGIHFFNPVAMMPLVEIVVSEETSAESRDDAIAFVRKIDKLPLPVKSKPGFLVNRVLMPYLMEAVALAEEGATLEEIDIAATNFGMPMGPVELADKVGLDVCLSVAKNLTSHYGGHIPERLEELVKVGDLGPKSSRGFYQYKNKKPIRQKRHTSGKFSEQEIADRLILRMLNESVACLREQIVEDEELLDAGMIFGTGFAPFRGGIIHYAETIGFSQLTELYKSYEERYGDRFKADKGLDNLEKKAA
jgi:3-hydroxyacyl-CoA dehydrogenase/enoyl-CoA hydratase/3-hydroxybutyryl-CoA epimerase